MQLWWVSEPAFVKWCGELLSLKGHLLNTNCSTDECLQKNVTTIIIYFLKEIAQVAWKCWHNTKKMHKSLIDTPAIQAFESIDEVFIGGNHRQSHSVMGDTDHWIALWRSLMIKWTAIWVIYKGTIILHTDRVKKFLSGNTATYGLN